MKAKKKSKRRRHERIEDEENDVEVLKEEEEDSYRDHTTTTTHKRRAPIPCQHQNSQHNPYDNEQHTERDLSLIHNRYQSTINDSAFLHSTPLCSIVDKESPSEIATTAIAMKCRALEEEEEEEDVLIGEIWDAESCSSRRQGRLVDAILEDFRCDFPQWSLQGMLEVTAEGTFTANFACCAQFGDEQVALFLNREDPYGLHQLLQSINLSYTKVTDLSLRRVLQKCPNLKTINIHCCPCVTNKSLSMIAQLGKNVESLNVSDCKNISDIGVQLIAQNLKSNLKSLDLSDCGNISDNVLHYLCYYCTALEILKLGNTKITEEGLSKALPILKLTELSLKGLPITDQTLSIITKNHKLNILDVSFCYNLSIAAFSKFLLDCNTNSTSSTAIVECRIFGNFNGDWKRIEELQRFLDGRRKEKEKKVHFTLALSFVYVNEIICR